jgi:DNA replication protein DnaC
MTNDTDQSTLDRHLDYLRLGYLKNNCRPLMAEAAAKHWTHLDYLARLIEGEAAARQDRAIARRIKEARFPVIKTLETFHLEWPKVRN